MSNVVLEGPDASGKSTLAKELAKALDLRIVPGKGPPKAPGEITRRVQEYLKMDGVIFDRHPCVSQNIYNVPRVNDGIEVENVSEPLLRAFYDTDPIFIYCHPPPDAMAHHSLNPEVDTDDHVQRVKDNYEAITYFYNDWAGRHAHLIYRIGMDRMPIIDYLAAMLEVTP